MYPGFPPRDNVPRVHMDTEREMADNVRHVNCANRDAFLAHPHIAVPR